MIKKSLNKKNILYFIIKLIIKILIIYILLIFLFKNNIILCDDLYNVENLKKEIFDELKKMSETKKFKDITGLRYIKDQFIEEFLNNINIKDLVNKKIKRSQIKNIIKAQFINNLKNIKKEFTFKWSFFVKSYIFHEIFHRRTHPKKHDFTLWFKMLNKGKIKGQATFIFNLTHILHDIVLEFVIILLRLLIFVGISYMFSENIFNMPLPVVNIDCSFSPLSYYDFLNIYKNFIARDYTVTDGILQKDLLTNIKFFFIPKQISYISFIKYK